MLSTTKISKALAVIANAYIQENENTTITCQVRVFENRISIYYEYTFRRDTCEGAYGQTKRQWPAINERLLKVATDPFIKRNFTVEKSLLNDKTKFYHDPSEDGYSEYEQSIESSLRLTLKQ